MESGYWPLYRFDPRAIERNENPLTIDSVIPGPDNSGSNGSDAHTTSPSYPDKEPVDTVALYIRNEDRYADLAMTDPSGASLLHTQLQRDCDLESEALGRIK